MNFTDEERQLLLCVSGRSFVMSEEISKLNSGVENVTPAFCKIIANWQHGFLKCVGVYQAGSV